VARNAVVPAILQQSSTACAALLIAWVIASNRSTLCLSEWVPPSRHLRHASLTVLRSSKRPERKIASACPNWICADERSLKGPLAATGVLVRASSVNLIKSSSRNPQHWRRYASRSGAHNRQSIKWTLIVGPRLEFRHHRKSSSFGYIKVGHRYVIAARASHPHNVPGVNYFAVFSGKIDHHHFRLAFGMLVNIRRNAINARNRCMRRELKARRRRPSKMISTPPRSRTFNRAGGSRPTPLVSLDILLSWLWSKARSRSAPRLRAATGALGRCRTFSAGGKRHDRFCVVVGEGVVEPR